MTYIPFTEEQKLRAANTDIAELLMQQGESLKRSGREYQWRDGSDKVTIKGNLWFHQYEQVGGNAIQFAKRFFNTELFYNRTKQGIFRCQFGYGYCVPGDL